MSAAPARAVYRVGAAPAAAARRRCLCRLWIVWVTGAVLVAGCVSQSQQGRGARAPEPVAVLLSSDADEFVEIGREITRRYKGGVRVYTLTRDSARQRTALAAIKKSNATVVVAVGLRAARMAQQLKGSRIIFCQTMNYEAQHLVSARSKGVAPVPAADKVLDAWLKINPRLSRVTVFTGHDMHDLVGQLSRAAAGHRVRLVHREVASDRELLYVYKKIGRDVEGVWLLPDNRILSLRTMRELLAYSVKHGKQVVVFNPQLLRLGGLMSAQPDGADVAQRVIARVHSSAGRSDVPGTATVPLTRARLTVNPTMAQRLGLTLPSRMPGVAYAQ